MVMQDILNANNFLLIEAAVLEALSRTGSVQLHPRLENAPLIYHSEGKEALSSLYQEYIDVARHGDVPIVLCTPTWRANRQRVEEARLSRTVNADAVAFLKRLRAKQVGWSHNILIGGLTGCKNDCYRPHDGLSADAAKTFHAWQVERLAQAEPDFLLAATLPALDEAAGMALAMAQTNLPYIISFVIDRRGRLLDGSHLADAIKRIDGQCAAPPTGYMINCAYPSFLNASKQPRMVFDRLIGYQANASSLDHAHLDHAAMRQSDALEDWGDRMVELNRIHGVKILGGCCGTRSAHLRYLVSHLNCHEGQTSCH